MASGAFEKSRRKRWLLNGDEEIKLDMYSPML